MCFKGDEKRSINHLSRRKEMSVLIGVAEEEEIVGELYVEEMVEEMEEVEPMGISLNSIVGITNQKTMKLLSRIGLNELIVMGATNNFISNRDCKGFRKNEQYFWFEN